MINNLSFFFHIHCKWMMMEEQRRNELLEAVVANLQSKLIYVRANYRFIRYSAPLLLLVGLVSKVKEDFPTSSPPPSIHPPPFTDESCWTLTQQEALTFLCRISYAALVQNRLIVLLYCDIIRHLVPYWPNPNEWMKNDWESQPDPFNWLDRQGQHHST